MNTLPVLLNPNASITIAATFKRQECYDDMIYDHTRENDMLKQGYYTAIDEIESLRDGWDGDGSVAISQKIISKIRNLINEFPLQFVETLSPDSIVPHDNGIVNVIFSRNDKKFILSIGEDSQNCVIIQPDNSFGYEDIIIEGNLDSFLCKTFN